MSSIETKSNTTQFHSNLYLTSPENSTHLHNNLVDFNFIMIYYLYPLEEVSKHQLTISPIDEAYKTIGTWARLHESLVYKEDTSSC